MSCLLRALILYRRRRFINHLLTYLLIICRPLVTDKTEGREGCRCSLPVYWELGRTVTVSDVI